MEKFLGVLFCGGRGKRLGSLSDYVSKPLIPVYDKPSFMFGLELLERSSLLSEIVILTNSDNDKYLRKTGHRTLIQDDNKVKDMISGWKFIKDKTGTEANGVLYPSDNIADVDTDKLIKKFNSLNAEFLFCLYNKVSEEKLMQMGNFDPVKNKFSYKPAQPFQYGVIAPYIIRNDALITTEKKLFEGKNSHYVVHKGMWRDIGDIDSLAEAIIWRRSKLK